MQCVMGSVTDTAIYNRNDMRHTDMDKAQTLRMANAAYKALDFLNNYTWTAYRDECCKLALDEERQHRAGKARTWGASMADCARLFTVRRIAEELTRPQLTVADIIGCQPSAMYAAAIAARYGEQVRAAWEGFDLSALAALDYCTVIATEQVPA